MGVVGDGMYKRRILIEHEGPIRVDVSKGLKLVPAC